METPIATSIDTINNALQSQITYWQDYNENLDNLNQRTGDIEGLSAVIATFADGSEDSIAAIAGLAKASDAELTHMVDSWQTLREEQTTVSSSIAVLVNDFTNALDDLQSELETAIEEMNLGDEAFSSGEHTVQGFISGMEKWAPQVSITSAMIAQAAMTSIRDELVIQSPSRAMMEIADYTWAGFVNQSKAMIPEVETAMAEPVASGMAGLEEMEIATLAPTFIQSVLSSNDPPPSGADSLPSVLGGDSVVINFSPQYHLEGVTGVEDLNGRLERHAGELEGMILAVLEKVGMDNGRRGFY